MWGKAAAGRWAAALAAALACSQANAVAAARVEGLASYRGKLQPGVIVHALTTPDFRAGGPSAAVSTPTDKDGKFALSLPKGKYYLVAFKKGKGVRPVAEPGDFYCYFSGNPVTVTEGAAAQVAFNLIQVPSDGETVAGPSGVEGTVLHDGKPLGRCYLYAYQDASGEFRGMGFSVTPVGSEGRFRLRLPPGRYYLIARQRQAGGMYGPLGRNDKVGFYYANPVMVTEGLLRRIALEVINIQESQTGEGGMLPPGAPAAVLGTVRDRQGRPLGDIYVLFYDNPETSGKPRFVSRRTGKDGIFRVEVPAGGKYYLLARQSLGGPPESGEFYGRYENSQQKPIPVGVGGSAGDVALEVVVGPYQTPGK